MQKKWEQGSLAVAYWFSEVDKGIENKGICMEKPWDAAE